MASTSWWMEFPNQIHTNEFHRLFWCAEMKLFEFKMFYLELFTNSTLLTMVKDIFLHIVPIVQLSDWQVDPLEPIVPC